MINLVNYDKNIYGPSYIKNDNMQVLLDEISSNIQALKVRPTREALEDIKLILNDVFKSSVCKDVLFTNNIDKQFFGVNVLPILPNKIVFDVLVGDEKFIVPEYYVEIDSKLLEECELSDIDAALIIIYNVSALIIDSTPIEKVRKAVNAYLIDTNSIIKKTDSFNYLELLSYGIKDALRKFTSVFDIPDEEIHENEFINNNSFSEKVLEIKKKIQVTGKLMFVNGETPIIVLAWVLKLYNDILKYRIDYKYILEDALKITPSTLDKREIKTLLLRLNRMDDVFTESMSVYNEGFLSDALRNFKESGLKGYESDYYELKFAANNVENEDEAYHILSQINSRMSVIADFLTTEENLSQSSKVRWTKLLGMYNDLRNMIASQKVYANKSRLYVNYGFED